MRIRTVVVVLALTAAQLVSVAPAHAYTECTSSVSRVFTGKRMSVWIALMCGKNAYQSAGITDREAFIAMASTALTTGRSVTVRFEADGVNCATAESRSDFISLWLN